MLYGNVSLFWRRANTSKQSKISKLAQAGTNTLPSNPLAIHTCIMFTSADPEGGGGSEPPRPCDLSEVGSCVEMWWVGEGVQRLFSLYYNQIFLDRFARQYYTNVLHIYILSSSIFSHPFSILPLSLWKESNLPSLAFMKGHLRIFLV